MIFPSLLENFKALSSGTDAFKQLKQHCEAHILNSEYSLEHSALFFILGLSKNYVLLYEDQAITPEFAKTAKDQLLDYMQQLHDAIVTENKILILETLNKVTADYLHSSRIF